MRILSEREAHTLDVALVKLMLGIHLTDKEWLVVSPPAKQQETNEVLSLEKL